MSNIITLSNFTLMDSVQLITAAITLLFMYFWAKKKLLWQFFFTEILWSWWKFIVKHVQAKKALFNNREWFQIVDYLRLIVNNYNRLSIINSHWSTFYRRKFWRFDLFILRIIKGRILDHIPFLNAL